MVQKYLVDCYCLLLELDSTELLRSAFVLSLQGYLEL